MFGKDDTHLLATKLQESSTESSSELTLDDGSCVAVIGGGPSGSFVSYFLFEMAERIGIDINVNIFEPREFSKPGPAGCNHCGGIISESLVQHMAADGINIPPAVVQRGIERYVLHMDVGSVNIDTPLHEKRIAAVYRGAGPLGCSDMKWGKSFDDFLLSLAQNRGAQVVRDRVVSVEQVDGRPLVNTCKGEPQSYDLVISAVGVNAAPLKIGEELKQGFTPPKTTKTYISELALGHEVVQEYMGSSMHMFLLNMPRLEFAALVPKGDFVTLVLLGENIDKELVENFLQTPEVKACLPPGWTLPEKFCHCAPKINIREAERPFIDRMVMIGDCGCSRLYKDGIGAAYRSAKAVARTAVFDGISAEDFKKHYQPEYKHMAMDNAFGKVIFTITRLIQQFQFSRRAILNMVIEEQQQEGERRHMSNVLWDTFTGSAPYKDVFLRTLHPAFISHFLAKLITALRPANNKHES
jgi:flavin-dependent dehydrogenase